jgi:hypothetical protein
MIIGITGVKRSGKDTSARYLSAHWEPEANERFIVYHLADPLKRALELIYGWDSAIWEGPEKEAVDPYWGVSPRQAAQLLGTEWSTLLSEKFHEYKQKTGQHTYLKAFLRVAEENPEQHYIVPDLRFKYEADAIRAKGGCILRIRRPLVEIHKDQHPSERDIFTIEAHAEIINDSTLDVLYDQLDEIANVLELGMIKQRSGRSVEINHFAS